MNYPLQLSFKHLALARQISVRDAGGQIVFYVKQKAFKLKESVNVFADAEQTRLLYTINANKILDFSARYQINDSRGGVVGAVARRGMKSLWRAHYEIYEGNNLTLTIREANPWTKVLDSLVGEVPIVGMFTGYMFHPSYVVERVRDGALVMRLVKLPAFLEGKFSVEKHAELDQRGEVLALLSLLMMVLLERRRG